MKNNPYQAYKQQSIMTMTQGDMLTTLYDGLVKELAYAKVGFTKKDFTEINFRLQKAQCILKYLQRNLDFHVEISNNLNMLYDYFLYTIVQVNIKKDPTSLDEIIGMIHELRTTYIEADKKTRSAEVAR